MVRNGFATTTLVSRSATTTLFPSFRHYVILNRPEALFIPCFHSIFIWCNEFHYLDKGGLYTHICLLDHLREDHGKLA